MIVVMGCVCMLWRVKVGVYVGIAILPVVCHMYDMFGYTSQLFSLRTYE